MSKQLFHGHLNEEIFMQQPPGYVFVGRETKACQLLKALYGLKQSPCMWYEWFTTHLLLIRYNKCNGDLNVYIQKTKDGTFILFGLYIC
jgi:hypothetical protein